MALRSNPERPASRPHPRRPRRPPRPLTRRIGLRSSVFHDLYHFVMVTQWWRFFALIAALYAGANALFAAAYAAVPGCLENARAGSFSDAFFFSVQTMATIGYGKMAPLTMYANMLVAIESLLGVSGLALITGLTFSKFARPTARVLFSEVAVVSPRDGVPSLMFRMANERTNQIAEVHLHAVLAIQDRTVEGEVVRRFYPLPLTRERAATFALTWTGIHPLTAESPLHGLTQEELEARGAEVIVSLTGIDETFAQTIHARGTYAPRDIVFGHRFADILVTLPDGGRAVDYSKFHDTLPFVPRELAARELGSAL